MHSKKNIQMLIIRYVIRRDLVYKRRLDSSWAKFASFTIVILISLCNKTNFILRCDGYYLLCANLIFFYFSFYSRSLFHFSNDVSTNRIIFFRKIGKFFTTINNKINNNELFFFSESLREYNGLSSDLYKPSNYDKLALSLLSPLPNEQDFAINVCTLLSNEGKHILRLDKYPRLVNILLAHAGVFDSPGTRQLFIEVYSRVRNYSINSFWSDVLDSQDVIDLTNERTFMKKPTTASPQTFSRRKILEREKQNKSAASTENGDEASTSMEVDGVRWNRITRVSDYRLIFPF